MVSKMIPSGHRQVIATSLTGQFFADLSFFEGRRYAARARGSVDSRVRLLRWFVYDQMEKKEPSPRNWQEKIRRSPANALEPSCAALRPSADVLKARPRRLAADLH